jgi:hypothetical protein
VRIRIPTIAPWLLAVLAGGTACFRGSVPVRPSDDRGRSMSLVDSLVDKVIALPAVTPETAGAAVGIPLAKEDENPYAQFYQGEGRDRLGRAGLRLDKDGPGWNLWVDFNLDPPLFVKDLDLARYGKAKDIHPNPHIPPEGATTHTYDYRGFGISFRFTWATERLLGVTIQGSGKRGPSQPSAYIGMATMDPSGTIFLDLRAEHEDGTIGMGRLVYSLTHVQYKSILEHLGGLAPGQSKPVLPFPEKVDPAKAALGGAAGYFGASPEPLFSTDITPSRFPWSHGHTFFLVMNSEKRKVLVSVDAAGQAHAFSPGSKELNLAALNRILQVEGVRLPEGLDLAWTLRNALAGPGGWVASKDFFQAEKAALAQWTAHCPASGSKRFEQSCLDPILKKKGENWVLEFRYFNPSGGVEICRAEGDGKSVLSFMTTELLPNGTFQVPYN